ncbi:PDR/VanB family oxidoreductase [Brucella sp. 2280]|uniref:PDR/VanB family oxidoreductase n=1 Tax=Brucella sp. 2280 TaxID=2592625 RepID=UPI00129710E9|nr:PDR/VanB family oxidoreductase [Brucella sp. 2280]QGA58730.1 2Fe-2S iron-sulfur cluster binding domain-containing protein [Brucella sp. 2280]
MVKNYISAKIARRQHVAENVLELVLTPIADSEFPHWEPGAHIDLALLRQDQGDGPIIRQYSLCGDPVNLSEYRIGVLREPEGRGGSAYIHDQLNVGDTVEISAPRNHFPFTSGQKTLFIAGGIGITPILPMVAKSISEDNDWQLIIAARSRTRLPFADLIAGLPQERIYCHCDDEQGRLDLAALLHGRGVETTVYSCGPARLLDALQELNRDAPWQLRIERFTASTVIDDTDNRPFEVICKRSGKTLYVPANKSLLEVLKNAGIKIDSSCRDGICGTCEIEVLSGTPHHRDQVLTREERIEGTHMMACVSRARGDVLELNI